MTSLRIASWVACLPLAFPSLSQSQTFAAFPIPTPRSGPRDLAVGPAGDFWFTEDGANQIGRLSTAGEFAEFANAIEGALVNQICRGPDGNIWFTETTNSVRASSGQIGRITPSGQIASFGPTETGWIPFDIVAGPDGNLWFTRYGYDSNTIGRITPLGILTEYELASPNSFPTSITAGPDGAVWFSEPGTASIGRITMGGSITRFPVGVSPGDLVTGPDGALWFTTNEAIGRMTVSGAVTLFPLPGGLPHDITAGSDGNIYFADRLLPRTRKPSSRGRMEPCGFWTG